MNLPHKNNDELKSLLSEEVNVGLLGVLQAHLSMEVNSLTSPGVLFQKKNHIFLWKPDIL